MTAIQSEAPLISVVMSCYNADRWLVESIESVLNQTWKDFEFIIVDDGSTDETGRIIARYAAEDGRIVPISKPNTGLSDSLNFGIAYARGEWVARLDADDISEQTRLARQVQVVHENPSIVLLGSGFSVIGENSAAKGRVFRYPSNHSIIVNRLSKLGPVFPHSSSFYRTKVVRAVGGYRTRLQRAQDIDLWLRLSEVGEICCIDSPLVKIRKHSAQISHDEGGRRQLVDAHVATVSYWLRRLGREDPVESESGAEFESFRTWVDDHVRINSDFELLSFLTTVKGQLEKQVGKLGQAKVVINAVIKRPPIFLHWFYRRIFYSGLPQQLALKWSRPS